MYNRILKIGLSAFFFITIAAGIAEGNEALLHGQLLSERCLSEGRLSACYLESVSTGKTVLFTGDRRLYKIEIGRIAQWKLDNAFGKMVAVKGVVKGNRIMVNDIAVMGGKKKLSKACL